VRAKTFAWLAHLYTATGLLCAAAIAILIVHGGDASFRLAFMLMAAATVIDATDGWLARRARVKDVLPRFDGRRLDDLVDFQTYTTLPLLLIWRADLLPGPAALVLVLALLASAYGFSQSDAKTDDGFFLGFPSYWNVVAFYLYMLEPPPAIAAGLIVVLSVMTFVPTRYLYVTRGGSFARSMIAGAVVWTVLIIGVLMAPADRAYTLAVVSLIYPAAYLLLSAFVALRA